MAWDAARIWGSTPEERRLELPCDRFLADPDDALFRAIDVEAPPPLLYRWLCQLRAAPYSYDLLDNFGRRSPRRLIEGLDRLQRGQRVMTIFELVEFEPGRQITLRLRRPSRVFGEVALTYLIAPRHGGGSRLVAKVLVAYPRGALGAASRRVLPAGDLVMMRKQLLTLKRLAERDSVRTDQALGTRVPQK